MVYFTILYQWQLKYTVDNFLNKVSKRKHGWKWQIMFSLSLSIICPHSPALQDENVLVLYEICIEKSWLLLTCSGRVGSYHTSIINIIIIVVLNYIIIIMMMVVLLMTIMFNVHAVLDQFIPHTLTKCQTIFRRNKNYDYYTIIFFTPPLELRCNVKSR